MKKTSWLESISDTKLEKIIATHWNRFGVNDSDIKQITIYREPNKQCAIVSHVDKLGRLGKTTYDEYGQDTTDVENVNLWAELYSSQLKTTEAGNYIEDCRQYILDKIISEKNKKLDQIDLAYTAEFERLEKEKREKQRMVTREILDGYQKAIDSFSTLSRRSNKKVKKSETVME